MIGIIIKSIIIGAVGGGAIAAGASRMFYAPEIQSMGAFRTLGELNACKGDAVTHFSFGLGFFFNAAASAVGAGALTQDVFHRIIPNWAAGVLLLKNKSVKETLEDPAKMFISGSVIGAVTVLFMNTIASVIPKVAAVTAKNILGPASDLMINPIMPIIFWLAALDSGKITGIWATILGGFSHMIMGNAVPGLVLGILIGQSVESGGYNKSVKIMIGVVTVLFVVIAYFRGFFDKLVGIF
ncbi:DUF4311 domain-containing protein [Acidilutibacter cellobiosedens]|jgi:uncharacterized protein (TIGR03580 family)|uniref:DUF4311 domain-containing protein n=1 Tax=Acidilutibacter cellobiosedens TaxID=2507161 RepID=A0A410Q998_9FIRM|nr:DUF4311 domain-containing protein [Acidilutibacter cellobiosedens]MBE6083319.1 DUF4311 domain-containing protein [Tissierellaceae bacterium]QAT60458.1 DUF4311 domain-containing protein [Acidilutibacter cellobiosedens]